MICSHSQPSRGKTALLALVLSLPLLIPAAHAAEAPSPYDADLLARRERFDKEAPGSPGAVVPLLGLPELWELCSDRQAVFSLAEHAAGSTKVLPEVRAYAQAVLRDLALHRGDKALAQRMSMELGLVHNFQVIGPFDNEGRKGHATVYPPEKEQTVPGEDLSYEGKSRAVPPRWRKVPDDIVAHDGSLLLDTLLRPDNWVTAYAASYVFNDGPAPRRIAVRAGSSGAIKVWVNRGAPVIEHDVYRPLHRDQEVGAAVLRPGWNRLLVKISGGEGAWSFVLRLTTPEGLPLKGVRSSAEAPAVGWTIPQAVSAAGTPSSSLQRGLRAQLLRVKGQKGPARVQALSDLGLYLHHVAPGNPEDKEDESLLGEAATLSPSLRNYRLLAQCTVESNDRRKALEAGLALPAGTGIAEQRERARLLLEMGKIYDEGRRDRLAEQAWREALRLDPALYTAALDLAQLQASRGMTAEAQHLMADLRDGTSLPLRLMRARAQLASQRSREAEGERRYQEILQQSQDDVEAMRHLLDGCSARGDLDAALSWLSRIQSARPELQWIYRDRIDLLLGAGRDTEALSEVEKVLDRLPGEAEVYQLRGRLLLRLGRMEQAVAAYHRALELRPQNPELRTYLLHLDPQARSGDDLARTYRVDVKQMLVGLQHGDALAQKRGGEPARVLLDQAATLVHGNGLSEVFTQRVVQILDDRGAREYGDFEIRFTPDTQSVQVKTARVYKKDGEVQEIAAQVEHDVSEPWYGLYYDVRAQSLRFDRLEVGDVIDVEYVVADVGRRNLLSDYFGDLHFFQEEVPRLDTRYILVVPEERGQRRPIYFNQPRGGPAFQVMRSERVNDKGQRVYTFSARNVPKLETEPGMPGFTELASYVHVSTYRNWEDVATWYAGLVQEQLQSTPEITRAAKAAVAGLTDDRAKVRAIYDMVVKRTRYVGLEFGIHGYKPYKVAQIYQRKFGDCKDKAALLKVMLREVGIDSSMVLARTRRNGNLEPEPASLSVFDHAIVYVPRFDLFLDGTAEFSGSDELPDQDQDIAVLIVSDPRPPYLGKGHLYRTPVLPPERNTVSRQLDVQLRPDGGARVKDQMVVSGQVAQKWREHYQISGSQKERYEKAWNELAPGTKVNRVEIPGTADLEHPVSLRGEVDVPAWGRPLTSAASGPPAPQPKEPRKGAAGDFVLRPLGRDPDLLRNFARLSQRRYDLILGFPWRNQEKVTVHLPPGTVVRRLPEARHIETPFGHFSLAVTRHGAEIVTEAELLVDRHRIKSSEYPAFRSFCAEVDSAVAQELVVGHE